MRKLEVLMFFLQNLHFNPTSMALLNICSFVQVILVWNICRNMFTCN